ncbi:MAG: TlyA family RNA methyltransferase [Hyphomicrobiaceae bacterium]|nr:TlyA family RNA methyltransferase [Hyphomicrobiaceae bacterium]
MEDTVQPARLDQVLVTRGLAATRSRARDLILRGAVSVDGKTVVKPAAAIPATASLSVTAEASDVSRGAVKLRAALETFAFDPGGKICLDIGASTGGFTQALLAGGAAKVYAVDVGHGQLAAALRGDERVVSLEGTDARSLTAAQIPDRIGAIVADVSFISLPKALAVPLSFAAPGAWLAALIKPQFEAGRDGIGKRGIVRNDDVRGAAVESVRAWVAEQPGWTVSGVIPSPITGGSGNQEFLLGARFHD